MTLDLHDSRTEIARCADGLRVAIWDWRTPDGFAADLRLAADAARTLCACEPAAWGDAPAAIARLLLPHRTPASPPSAQAALVSHWALHLFALLSAAPTIKRTLIEVAPVYASGETLARLRKRLDEVCAIVDALKRTPDALSAHARITFQLIALSVDLMRAAMQRERVDLRLVEYAAADVASRANSVPAKSAPRMFQDLAERADAAVWESNRLIQTLRPGAPPKRVA